MPATETTPSLFRNCLVLGFWSIIAVLGGIYLSRQPDNIATIWFANALAVAFCYQKPPRQWLALFTTYGLSNLAGNLVYGDELLLSLSFVPGNTLEVAFGTVLLAKIGRIQNLEYDPFAMLRLLAWGAAIPGLLGATLGAATVAWHGFAPFSTVWPSWYIGSLIGSVALLPFATSIVNKGFSEIFYKPPAIKVLLIAGLAITTTFLALSRLSYPYTYTMMPLLLAAFLLKHQAMNAILLLNTLAIATLISFGGFHPSNEHGWAIFVAYLPIFITQLAPLLLSVSLRQRAHDIDLANTAEIKSRESSQLLDAVIEHIPSMVFLKRAEDLRFLLFNKAGEQLTGFSRQDLMGKNDYDFFPKEQADFFTGRDRWVLSQKEADIQEEPISTAHQGERLLRTQKVAICDEKGHAKYLLGISEDITERKAVEQELIKSRASAEKASRAKSEFLANMSHEIRTPMNAVLGATHLLKSTPLSAEQNRLLNMVDTAGQSLMQILNDILDFSKIEAGRLELSPISFSLNRVMKSLATIMAMNAGHKPIELAIGNNTHLTHNLIGDELRLHQILVNLLGNAIKFTEQGAVSLTIFAAPINESRVQLRFIIRDSGIGMTPEQQELVFKAFTQADASTTRRFGGTGLGLTITQHLVEMMGGSIYFTSALGKGTEFQVQLPFELDLHTMQRPEPSVKSLRFLLVDDNEVARDCMQNNITLWGWHADVASSGVEALDLIKRSIENHMLHYDVLLIDWQMPGLDGLATLSAIRELMLERASPPPAIIALAARDYDHFTRADTQHLADVVLMKPITSSSLFDAVHEKLLRTSIRSEPTAAINTQPTQTLLKGLTILLVEDNALNQTVASMMLERAGAQLDIADDGLIALAMVKAHPNRYDIILMDAHMPNMDGITATQHLCNELNWSKPIIAMTAGVTEGERARCMDAGMIDFIAKPIDEAAMLATLRRYASEQSDNPTPTTPNSAATTTDSSPIALFLQLYAFAQDNAEQRLTMQKTLDNVAKTCEAKIDEVAELWNRGQRDGAASLCHTLKGSIGSLGAQDFHRAANALEQAIKTQDAARIPELHSALKQQGQTLVDCILTWQREHRD